MQFPVVLLPAMPLVTNCKQAFKSQRGKLCPLPSGAVPHSQCMTKCQCRTSTETDVTPVLCNLLLLVTELHHGGKTLGNTRFPVSLPNRVTWALVQQWVLTVVVTLWSVHEQCLIKIMLQIHGHKKRDRTSTTESIWACKTLFLELHWRKLFERAVSS